MQPPPSENHPRIRFKAGRAFGEGRVEVYYRRQWGTVCARNFNKESGNVLCREMGFGTVREIINNGSMGQGKLQEKKLLNQVRMFRRDKYVIMKCVPFSS